MFQDEKRLKPQVFWSIFIFLVYLYLNAIMVRDWDVANIVSSLTVYLTYIHFEVSKH